MPIKHLRICERCDRVRFAGCSIACRVPSDTDPSNWLLNVQEGAGEMRAPEEIE